MDAQTQFSAVNGRLKIASQRPIPCPSPQIYTFVRHLHMPAGWSGVEPSLPLSLIGSVQRPPLVINSLAAQRPTVRGAPLTGRKTSGGGPRPGGARCRHMWCSSRPATVTPNLTPSRRHAGVTPRHVTSLSSHPAAAGLSCSLWQEKLQ